MEAHHRNVWDSVSRKVSVGDELMIIDKQKELAEREFKGALSTRNPQTAYIAFVNLINLDHKKANTVRLGIRKTRYLERNPRVRTTKTKTRKIAPLPFFHDLGKLLKWSVGASIGKDGRRVLKKYCPYSIVPVSTETEDVDAENVAAIREFVRHEIDVTSMSEWRERTVVPVSIFLQASIEFRRDMALRCDFGTAPYSMLRNRAGRTRIFIGDGYMKNYNRRTEKIIGASKAIYKMNMRTLDVQRLSHTKARSYIESHGVFVFGQELQRNMVTLIFEGYDDLLIGGESAVVFGRGLTPFQITLFARSLRRHLKLGHMIKSRKFISIALARAANATQKFSVLSRTVSEMARIYGSRISRPRKTGPGHTIIACCMLWLLIDNSLRENRRDKIPALMRILQKYVFSDLLNWIEIQLELDPPIRSTPIRATVFEKYKILRNLNRGFVYDLPADQQMFLSILALVEDPYLSGILRVNVVARSLDKSRREATWDRITRDGEDPDVTWDQMIIQGIIDASMTMDFPLHRNLLHLATVSSASGGTDVCSVINSAVFSNYPGLRSDEIERVKQHIVDIYG